MNEQREWLNEKAVDVLKDIPRPFGTFTKARYVLSPRVRGNPFYAFTTTVHSESECINMLIKMYDESYHADLFFRISKVQKGKRKTVYTNHLSAVNLKIPMKNH